MNDYKPQFVICNSHWINHKRVEPPYLIAFFHKVSAGTRRGEDSGALYPVDMRGIDFVYDISNVINEIINGIKLIELYWRVQKDSAITIPTNRHLEITNWLLKHDELLVDNKTMSQYDECLLE